MIHLEIAGQTARLGSTLCAACPQGSTACCVSPPALSFPDIGRVVSLGGKAWLLAEIAAGSLVPGERGLHLQRVRRRTASGERRSSRCVFHGLRGCTIEASRRPTTCNSFLCDDAFTEGGEGRGDPAALSARRIHAALSAQQVRWTDLIAERASRAWPDGLPWDAAFLDWLGAEVEALAREAPDLATLMA
jgi:hypothetical protein